MVIELSHYGDRVMRLWYQNNEAIATIRRNRKKHCIAFYETRKGVGFNVYPLS